MMNILAILKVPFFKNMLGKEAMINFWCLYFKWNKHTTETNIQLIS